MGVLAGNWDSLVNRFSFDSKAPRKTPKNEKKREQARNSPPGATIRFGALGKKRGPILGRAFFGGGPRASDPE